MDPITVIPAILIMFAAVYAAFRFSKTRVVRRIHCDTRDADYLVQFAHEVRWDWSDGDKVDVCECEAFGKDPVTCDKNCLR